MRGDPVLPDVRALIGEFVKRINAHDPRHLAEMLTEDHRFVDASGAVFTGRRTMRQGWESFFGMFPDYRIDLDSLVVEGETVALFGWASGTFSGGGPEGGGVSFRIPAAWRAVVRDGLVAEWTVYADIEPMLRAAGGSRVFPGSSG